MFVFLGIRQAQDVQRCDSHQYLDHFCDYRKMLFTHILNICTTAWNNMLCRLPDMTEVESKAGAFSPNHETQWLDLRKKESAPANGRLMGNQLCALRYPKDPDFDKQFPLSDGVHGDLFVAKLKRGHSPFKVTIIMALLSVEIANAPMSV
jgi:hypothetical protein